MRKEELYVVLEEHHKWVLDKSCGERADLREENLCGADLCEADLREADLREADLRRADLYGAALCGADLRRANLRRANLCVADLRGADLRGADLRRANLRGANLREANLYGADLRGADLREADLEGIDDKILIPMACPSDGEFIGWKKCRAVEEYLVKLLIPEDAKRCSATGRKCRASKAKVLEIIPIGGSVETIDCVYSMYDPTFKYEVGMIVWPKKPFDEDRWKECSSGIHFFITREEAENYNG